MSSYNGGISDINALEDLSFLNRQHGGMRGDRWDHDRLDWDDHVEQLTHENQFQREYRMSVRAHGELVRILDPILERCEYNARCTHPIQVEHIVGAGLRVVAGGTVCDNRHVVGMSLPASYTCFNDFIYAVNTAPELNINLPTTPDEWHAANRGFRAKQTEEIMDGTCLAVDGFFQRSNKPTRGEVSNQIAYYSGHYEAYGVNCQAAVLSDLQFAYFGVVGPGSMNDCIAYPIAKELKSAIDNLPDGLYAVADAAYTLSNKMLIPFTGADRLNQDMDAFNFYLSQLRIRVEMAFGRLVNKFRILSGKIGGPLERVADILLACARLHNFIIQQDGPSHVGNDSFQEEMDDLDFAPVPDAPFNMGYLPAIPDEMHHLDACPGNSHTRDAIVEMISEYTIRRPTHNILRQQMEEEVFATSPRGVRVHRDFISPR